MDDGALRPGSTSQGVDECGGHHLGVLRAVGPTEDVGPDGRHEPADLGALDQVDVETVGPTERDELLEDGALTGRQEVHDAAARPEFEAAGQIAQEVREHRATGPRDVEGEPGRPALDVDPTGIAAGCPVAERPPFEQRDVHAIPGAEVGRGTADDAAADDEDRRRCQLGVSTLFAGSSTFVTSIEKSEPRPATATQVT